MLMYELLELKDKDIVSIVGAGGKTTLMFLLANEIKDYNKVLVTTTTKIYKPSEKEVKYLVLKEDGTEYIKNNTNKGIYVYGSFINEENKLLGIEPEELDDLKESFNCILIEADGSKKKSLKAWNEHEPVIYNRTTKTIGVLSLKAFGMEINNENIHRFKEFIDLTKCEVNEKVNLDILIKIIFSENGLFKNSKGEKILFINRADLVTDDILEILIKKIIYKNNKVRLLSKIIYGSLKEKNLKCIKL